MLPGKFYVYETMDVITVHPLKLTAKAVRTKMDVVGI